MNRPGPRWWVGPVRLSAVGAGVAAVIGAAALSPARDQPAGTTASSDGGRGALTEVEIQCPGTELSGLPGVADVALPGFAIAAEPIPAPLLSSMTTYAEGSPRDGDVVIGKGTPAVVAAGRSMAPGFAAGQQWNVSSEDVAGLTTTPCAPATDEAWLLAGGGAPGRRERLILSNAGGNEVSVDIEVLGRSGALDRSVTTAIVPARGRSVMLLDGISGAEASPAVRIRAAGGLVSAVIADTWLEGTSPVGAETVTPTAPPATRQLIPAAAFSGSGSIRVAVPGDQPAVVRTRVLSEQAPRALPKAVVTVPAGSVGEVPLTDLAPGRYVLEVVADVPVVASMWSSYRTGTTPEDYAWAPAVAPGLGAAAAAEVLTFAAPVTQPPLRRDLSVVATRGPARLEVWSRTGDQDRRQVVDLAADRSRLIDLGAAQAVWLRQVSGAGEVHGGVITSGAKNSPARRAITAVVPSAVVAQVSRVRPAGESMPARP